MWIRTGIVLASSLPRLVNSAGLALMAAHENLAYTGDVREFHTRVSACETKTSRRFSAGVT